MDEKLKFFDETFKALLAVSASLWAVYVLFIIFAGDSVECAAGNTNVFVTMLAVATGVSTAPPLLYGLVRLLFWPNGPKNQNGWIAGTVLSVGVGIFVTVVVLFALAISHYGCR